MKALAAAPRALTPLAVLAAVLALVVPSGALADRSDLLLALLVLATALGISVPTWPGCGATQARSSRCRWCR